MQLTNQIEYVKIISLWDIKWYELSRTHRSYDHSMEEWEQNLT
jgi:hypothetical protein